MAGDLIPSVSITALLQARDAMLDRFEQARALLIEANQIGAQFDLGQIESILNGSGYGRDRRLIDDDAPQEFRRRLDAAGWRMLMDRSGMVALMDSQARDEWRRQLDDGARSWRDEPSIPELTADNIAATFGDLHGQRQAMFERGVVEVFRGLSWNYKTNSPVKIGKRIIVGIGSWSHHNNHLDDLDRVLHVLDGRPQPDHRSSLGAQTSSARLRDARAAIETDYLRLQCHKKGTGHVTFKRPDLVDAMNRIIAGQYPGALPEPRPC